VLSKCETDDIQNISHKNHPEGISVVQKLCKDSQDWIQSNSY